MYSLDGQFFCYNWYYCMTMMVSNIYQFQAKQGRTYVLNSKLVHTTDHFNSALFGLKLVLLTIMLSSTSYNNIERPQSTYVCFKTWKRKCFYRVLHYLDIQRKSCFSLFFILINFKFNIFWLIHSGWKV